jgi:hypothetical protein
VEVEVPVIEPATHAVKLVTQRKTVPAAEVLVPATDVVRLATTSATVPLPPLVVEAKRASTAAWRGKL